MQKVNWSVHTAPAQSQSGSPGQSAGSGSQRRIGGPNGMSLTHIQSAGHSSQSGTTLHISAGTQVLDQQAPSTPGSWPSGQSGGRAGHRALEASQSRRSVMHRPSLQIAASTPIASHTVWSHSSRQIGRSSPAGMPLHSQQSAKSSQSASDWHASGTGPVSSLVLSVVIVVVDGSVEVVIGSLGELGSGPVEEAGAAVSALPAVVGSTGPVEPVSDDAGPPEVPGAVEPVSVVTVSSPPQARVR